jgi:hypothetical protein
MIDADVYEKLRQLGSSTRYPSVLHGWQQAMAIWCRFAYTGSSATSGLASLQSWSLQMHQPTSSLPRVGTTEYVSK